MRDYLYIWHEIETKFIIASGIEFKSIANQFLQNRGIILLNHNSENTKFDESSRFEYVSPGQINDLAKEDIYSWGDFCWVDYSNDIFPKITKNQIAEILYFGHKVEPFDQVRLDSLNNKFMFYAHDDGWFLKMYYESWNDVRDLISSLELIFNRNELIAGLEKTENAFWISNGIISPEKKTLDVDKILNKKAYDLITTR